MDRDYCRSLAPRLLRYFKKLEASEPDNWKDHLALAQDFASLVLKDETEWKSLAKQLRPKVRLLGEETALQELALALDNILANPPPKS